MPTTAAPEQTLQGLLMAAAHVQQTAENLPDPARTSALSVADRAARVARAVATVDAPIGLAALDDAVEVVREAWRLAATYATHADDPVATETRVGHDRTRLEEIEDKLAARADHLLRIGDWLTRISMDRPLAATPQTAATWEPKPASRPAPPRRPARSAQLSIPPTGVLILGIFVLFALLTVLTSRCSAPSAPQSLAPFLTTWSTS